MAGERHRFTRNLYLLSLGVSAAFSVYAALLCWAAAHWFASTAPIVVGLGTFAAGALASVWIVSALIQQVLKPVGRAADLARRVAGGDLSVGDAAIAAARPTEGLTQSFVGMVSELRGLIGAIRENANDAASMAQQISSATEEMSASTQEVSGTCNDLTDRANRQANLVRSAAEDAARILAIAEQLAQSAMTTAERNAALARLARGHRSELDRSSSELQRLAEEVERGAEEAMALATASEEIEKFVTQTKMIARQTHMLALNAGIEAARAGAEGRGFAVVAEEVRKLAGQAAQAATSTSETVRSVQQRVTIARDRLLRLAQGGQTARDAAHTAAEGLSRVASEAEENDAWTRQISESAGEVRGLIDGIAGRMTEISGGTEDVAAAAEQIAASAEELSASTQEIAASAEQLARAAQSLNDGVGKFRVA